MRHPAFTISILLLVAVSSSIAAAQAFKKMDVPLKEATGGYHGGISVSDAKFINSDQHIVFAINESITVCETATGKRLHTLLNARRSGKSEDRGKHYGWTLRTLHLVDDGRVVMTDVSMGRLSTISIRPDNPIYSPCRWMRWDVSEITSEAEVDPVPTPFFSREGMNREESNSFEKGLHFITQIGADYVFLFNFHSKNLTKIRTYRPGDRIDRPREEIPFDHSDDPTIEHVFVRGDGNSTFHCGTGTSSQAQENLRNDKSYVLQRILRDADGKLTLTGQPIELSNPIDVRRQSIIRHANGAIQSSGAVLVDRFQTRILDNKIVPLRGILLHDQRFLALSGHATVYYQNGYRSKDPVAVTILDRETNKPVLQLPCGKGWMAKPLAISSDDSKLLTVHTLPRPDVRVWTLKTGTPPPRYYPDDDVFQR